mgnify:CR=1 FL=1
MPSHTLKHLVLFSCLAIFSAEIFGKETCGMNSDLYPQVSEKLHYVKNLIKSELINNDRRLVILDRLQGQFFDYPSALIKLSNSSAARSKSELLEAVRLSRESSHKLENLLKEIQVLSYINRQCNPINKDQM